jgi:LPS sulfotransferase NodH
MRPSSAVVICAAPRTGSGVLCEALWSTGLCGRPDEYLEDRTRREYEAEWGVSGDRAYAEGVLAYGTTPNGVFSIKVQWTQLDRAGLLGGLTRLAPDVRFCRVARRDRVRQAVSSYVASRTGRYTRREGDPHRTSEDLPFDLVALRREIGLVIDGERRWERYFTEHGIEPTRVWYEDDLATGCAETSGRLLATFAIDAPDDLAVTVRLQRQSDDRSERLVQRLREALPDV